jgi:hypothetical protein
LRRGPNLGIQGLRDSGIQEFRDSGIQGFRNSGIRFYIIEYILEFLNPLIHNS